MSAHILTEDEAVVLAEAREVLRAVEDRCMRQSWDAPAKASGNAVAAPYFGRIAGMTETAATALTDALIGMQVYGKCPNAGKALS